jgi:succinoglycan biosynthesis transport protein ExoP
MEFRGYLDILRRRWWVLILLPVLAAGTAYLATKQLTPIYRATAVILVNQTQEPGVVQYNDILTSERLTNTYAEMVERRVLLNQVISELDLPLDEEGLDDKVNVSVVRNTQLLNVAVEDANPDQAALIANTLAQAFIDDNSSQFGRPGTVSVTDEAVVPRSPAKPNVALNTVLGAILGLMLAGLVVTLQEYLDDTVKTPEDVEQITGVVALGVVSRFKERDPRLAAGSGPTAEAYRRVRTNVGFARLSQEAKAILVTSANPGEGKSTTAANLAQVMAQAGDRVLLVDTDFRRPSQHLIFDLPNSAGLTALLLNDNLRVAQVALSGGLPNLKILPSGTLPPNPSELLASDRMKTLVETLRNSADYVIFDSPPVSAVTDASILASLTDGTIVVLEMGKTRPDALRQTRSALLQANARLLGVVINKAESQRGGYYYTEQYAAAPKRSSTSSDQQSGQTPVAPKETG